MLNAAGAVAGAFPSGDGDGSGNGTSTTDVMASSNVAVSVGIVAAGAVTLRLGGRAALLSAIGMDAALTEDIRVNLDTALGFFADHQAESLVLFLAGWIATKLTMIDALGVVLAISSGVIFGGVLQGAAASAACATVGGLIAFSIARYSPLREKVAGAVAARPGLRAIERAVAKGGAKTILTLRLAPILPIPVAAYNYLYGGATTVGIADFVAGTFVGSLKPYALDAYIGVVAQQAVSGAPESGVSDLILFASFVAIVVRSPSVARSARRRRRRPSPPPFPQAVGAFATQLATSAIAEVQAEMAELEAEEGADGEDKVGGGGGLDFFFGRADDADADPDAWKAPAWVDNVKRDSDAAWGRLERLVDEESALRAQGVPCDDIPPAESFVAATAAFERNVPDDAPEPGDLGATLLESLIFGFVLCGSFVKYLDGAPPPAKG